MFTAIDYGVADLASYIFFYFLEQRKSYEYVELGRMVGSTF